jgi:hypothetical protein
MFPFDRPKDYGEMLNKIGIFTFFVALSLTWFIAREMPSVALLLNLRQTTFDVASIHVPILYALVAGAVALFARVIRLHDLLSDVFKIRERFDVKKILIPLCVGVGLRIDNALCKTLKAKRDVLMERTFYRYASFEDPKISKALVLSAIDLWTWYWVDLEAAFLCFLASLMLLLSRDFMTGVAVVGASVGLVLIFSSSFTFCGKKAQDQVSEIIADEDRARTIKAEISKLAP